MIAGLGLKPLAAMIAAAVLLAGYLWVSALRAENSDLRTSTALLMHDLKTVAAQQELAEAQRNKLAAAEKRSAGALSSARAENSRQAAELAASIQQESAADASLSACFAMQLPPVILRQLP